MKEAHALPNTLAQRLRYVRQLAGLSAYRVDRLADLTVGHTGSVERSDKRSLDITTAAKLAIVLGFSIDWLVTGEGVAPSRRRVRASVKRAVARCFHGSGAAVAVPAGSNFDTGRRT